MGGRRTVSGAARKGISITRPAHPGRPL